MSREYHPPKSFHSISQLHQALGLPRPYHPLVSLVDYAQISGDTSEISKALVMDFYKISYKRNLTGQVKYGQQYYDFNEGGLSFVSPNQLISGAEDDKDYSGYTLLVHPDLIRNFPLGSRMQHFGFFSYSVSEALHLSEREKEIIISIFQQIDRELQASVDDFSQDIIVSQIEQLLNYSNRFYRRQFTTRKSANSNLLTRFEQILDDYFNQADALNNGLPAVDMLAEKLNVSPRYLGDMLRATTGLNTQQQIHQRLITKAKELLISTNLDVAEIAYQLGFEHPQSFHKIFKQKTHQSPLEFRRSFQ